jgi:hypothetical protein
MPRQKAARGGLTVLLHSPALDPPALTVEEGAKEADTHLPAVLARRRGDGEKGSRQRDVEGA